MRRGRACNRTAEEAQESASGVYTQPSEGAISTTERHKVDHGKSALWLRVTYLRVPQAASEGYRF